MKQTTQYYPNSSHQPSDTLPRSRGGVLLDKDDLIDLEVGRRLDISLVEKAEARLAAQARARRVGASVLQELQELPQHLPNVTADEMDAAIHRHNMYARRGEHLPALISHAVVGPAPEQQRYASFTIEVSQDKAA